MKCKHIKTDGTQCKAEALHNREYCYFHEPEIEHQRTIASSKGGKKRLTILEPLPERKIKNINDLQNLITELINNVRTGKTDIRTANSLGFLADKMLKIFDYKREIGLIDDKPPKITINIVNNSYESISESIKLAELSQNELLLLIKDIQQKLAEQNKLPHNISNELI